MTARELIAKLAALDPDARLFIRYPSEMGNMPSLDLVDGLRPLNEGDLRDSFATDVVEIGRDHLLW